MSSRRPRFSGVSDDEISNLILKLQEFLPYSSSAGSSKRASAQESKIIEEICNSIKRLHQNLDYLSEKVSRLLDSVNVDGFDAETIRSLLQQ